MVKKESPAYLFIGDDPFSKDAKLQKIKEEFLKTDIEIFNLDILYASANEFNLRQVQERFLCLPVKSRKRIIVIKDAQCLKEDVRGFILEYAQRPPAHIILVLDINRYDPKDEFVRQICKFAQVCRFKEHLPLNTFALTRQVEFKKGDLALKILNQLLKNGEKPERILGGLRHSLIRNVGNRFEVKRRLRLLLGCDWDIKMGRLKPAHALEKFIVNLCCLGRNLAR